MVGSATRGGIQPEPPKAGKSLFPCISLGAKISSRGRKRQKANTVNLLSSQSPTQ